MQRAAFPPPRFRVDLSINAATKYPSGHSDVLIGLVSANAARLPALKAAHTELGVYLGPDDVFLTLRGLRTMNLRMKEQGCERAPRGPDPRNPQGREARAAPRPPLLPRPRDLQARFQGAVGMFSIILDVMSDKQVAAFLNNLGLFGMGYSWGGYESLAVPFDCSTFRTATTYAPRGAAFASALGLRIRRPDRRS